MSDGVVKMKVCKSHGRILSNLATEICCQSAQNSIRGANKPNCRCTTVGSKVALPQRGVLASLRTILQKTINLVSSSLCIKAGHVL